MRSIRPKLTLSVVLLLAAPPALIAAYFSWFTDPTAAVSPQQLVRLMLGSIAVAVLIGLVLGYRVAGSVMGPIGELTQAANRMKAGHLEERVNLNRGDELDLLAHALNQLAAVAEEKVRELSEERSRLTAVLSNLLSGVLLIDPEGEVILANRTVRRLLSLHQDPVGRNHRYVHRNYLLASAVERVMETGEPVQLDITLHNPEEIILQVSLLPLPVGTPSGPGVLAILHDITESRRLQRLKANLIADVSHELRTPVTAIRGFAETLLQGALEREGSARRFVQIIGNEATRLERLIEDLMELSRIESHGVEFREEPVELNGLVRSVGERFAARAEESSIELKVRLAEEPLVVLGDSYYLEQAVANLVDNALKYTPEGGLVLVEVLRLPSERAEISVQDTGVGIPEEDLPYVFDRFFRVEKARSRKGGGTGLGLAIAKHIVSAHHGEIGAESQLGEGSRFWLRLPLSPGEQK